MRQKKDNFWQNTVCFEQKIYTNQEKFTQTLFVIFMTFKRSCEPKYRQIHFDKQIYFDSFEAL